MSSFEDILTFGLLLGQIRESLSHVISIFNAVQLASLLYETKEEEYQTKKQYYNRVKIEIMKLNEKISNFNRLKNSWFSFLGIDDIEKVDITLVKNIIYEHKGDYPRERINEENPKIQIRNYIMGTDSSASSLARKNTLLKLQATLIPVKGSLSNFIKSRNEFLLPFAKIEKTKVRKSILSNINEATEVYSIGLFSNAVFIVGKTLEKMVGDYLSLLKKNKKINFKKKEFENWDFDTKINILHKKKFLTESQYSKIMSIKWDRNTLGHPSKRSDMKQARDDADAIIKIGINLINLIEKKIGKFHKRST